MKASEKKKIEFSKNFYWGASTAAHQVEGGNHNQWSIWELEYASTRASEVRYELNWLSGWEDLKDEATNPKNYVSGKATDHFNKYEEDFDILTDLNMNAFRFSIEWSRIEPKEGEWSAAALEHYRLYLHALQRRGIEPFVTLWHWTMPEWFVEMGGFEKRSNIKYFIRFVQKVCKELGQNFRFVITLNEPEVYIYLSYVQGEWPPMLESKSTALRVYFNLIAAHKQAYMAMKEINRKFKVTHSCNYAYNFAGDDSKISKNSAKLRNKLQYNFLDRTKKYLDLVGVNYYFTNRFYGTRVHNPDEKVSDLGWDLQPQNIEHVLKEVYKRVKLPIIITENGLADRSDRYRQWWIKETIQAMNIAISDGVKLEGYLHWSLLDNFEWAYGFWPRFGLVEVDYKTFERKLRPSAKWFGDVIKKARKS